ncbi:MAG: hypothetical protein ABSH51_03345 [Solirubrobacteraceae bacterium]|jgi:hypothetical protein
MLDARAQAFRESFFAHTVAARAGGPSAVRDWSIAGERVRVTVVGDALAGRLLPALEHLVADPGPPDVELIAWTDTCHAGPPVELPWSAGHLGPRGGVHGLLEPPVASSAAFDGSSLVLWDAERRIASSWWRDAGALRTWDPGAPLRIALHFALRRENRMLVHAACVGAAGAGVLLAGRSGSGKSTTTAACLAAGLQAVGDDYAVLDTSAREPRAHSIYRTVRVTPALARRTGAAEDDGRRTQLIGVDVPGTMAQSLRIVAVLVPRVVDARRSKLAAITPARALRAVLPSTLLQAPREPHQDIRAVADLVASVPCFELMLGADRGVAPIVEAVSAAR